MALVETTTPAPHLRLLTLNEPETRNAISFDLTTELYAALDALRKDNDCSVVLLTGDRRVLLRHESRRDGDSSQL